MLSADQEQDEGEVVAEDLPEGDVPSRRVEARECVVLQGTGECAAPLEHHQGRLPVPSPLQGHPPECTGRWHSPAGRPHEDGRHLSRRLLFHVQLRVPTSGRHCYLQGGQDQATGKRHLCWLGYQHLIMHHADSLSIIHLLYTLHSGYLLCPPPHILFTSPPLSILCLCLYNQVTH